MSTVVKAWISRLLDRAEDPSVTLDYSYERQREQLQKVKKGVAEVDGQEAACSRPRSSRRAPSSISRPPALGAGRGPRGRRSSARLLRSSNSRASTSRSPASRPSRRSHRRRKRLAAKVEAFRTQKETIKAEYSAAEAQVRITEAASGIGEEMADTGSPSSARATRPSRCRPAPPPSTSSSRQSTPRTSRRQRARPRASRRSRPAHRWTKSSRA